VSLGYNIIFAQGHLPLCQASTSTLDMSSSLTLNQVTSPLQLLENSWTAVDTSASLEERVTKMVEFTFTASSILEGREDSDDLLRSMWEATILTSHHLGEHLKRVGTMQQKMATFLGNPSTTRQAEVAILEILLSGLRSRARAIESRFGLWYMNWIPKVRRVLSPNFKSTVTGSSLLCLPPMNPRQESASPLVKLTDEINGYNKLVSEWENHC